MFSRLVIGASALVMSGPFWLSSGAWAVPPPPVPQGRIASSLNIERVAAILEGVWRGKENGHENRSLELRVGHFGQPVSSYILIGRIVHIPQGRTGASDLRISYLSALFYSVPCHAFQLISLDRIGEAHKSLNDCDTAFPIIVNQNGSVSFEYLDPSTNEHVRVSVSDREWRERRSLSVRSQSLVSGFVAQKIGGEAEWGDYR